MNVTRDVVADLLPIYFAGEASEDTKVLVEDYFRSDPDFERIARNAATPLDTLRAAAPVAASSEKEKRYLESVLWGLRRRKWLFGLSLFLTIVPLSFDFSDDHIVSLMVREAPWHAAFDWSVAAVLWFLYFARLRHRTAAFVCATAFTVIPIPFVWHAFVAGGSVLEFVIIWIGAACIWFRFIARSSPHPSP